MRHSTEDLCSQSGNLGKTIGIIWCSENCFANIFTYLVLVDIKCCGELDIADMISTKIYMHHARDKIIWFCFAVVLYALHERTCTVTDSNNSNTHFLFTCHTSLV